MKTSLLTSLAIVSLSTMLLSPPSFAQAGADGQPASQAHVLERAELDALLAHPTELLIVDVRRPDELASIGGFPVYLSIQIAELEAHLAAIPRDRTIVTVSNHAGRAKRAADLLRSRGFKVAGAIGAQDYESAGGTLSKPAPPARAP